jgi:integrase
MATPEEEAILSRFRAVLARQAIGKSPTDPLIGTGHDRWWIRRQVGRLCQLAKVPVVCAHALRGTHVSAAYEEGESPAMVARSVGHAGTAVGQRHYATQEAQAAGRQKRALTALQGEVTGKSFDFPMTSQGPSCTPEAR